MMHLYQISGEFVLKGQFSSGFPSYILCICVFLHSRNNVSIPPLLEDPVLNAIAKKHNRTPGQVSLRYLLQRGVVVLAKSFNEKRIKENTQVNIKQHL